jgi:hypothetical protein
VDQTDYELLAAIERSGRVFRPEGGTPEARAAFQGLVERLLHLRAVGLIRMADGRIMKAQDGSYLMAGPCDLTAAGIAALSNDRRLGERPPSDRPNDPGSTGRPGG